MGALREAAFVGAVLMKEPHVRLLSEAECWSRLPPTRGPRPEGHLPNWIRGVAEYLPRTAAAMLRLDLAQRRDSPLDPIDRASARFVIADGNRCDYGRETAAFDLEQLDAGPRVAMLRAGEAAWPDDLRPLLGFARQMTLDATAVTDEEFARLVGRYGPQRTAALVLLCAYGNFQDRLALALGLPIEAGGPQAPLDVEFAPGTLVLAAPPQPPRRPERTTGPFENVVPAESRTWTDLDFADLQARLEEQRRRPTRLPVPRWEEVKSRLPVDFPTRGPVEIVWTLVCLGYVPELALPWILTTRTFWNESHEDRVLEESLFWVQTRALRCNYCMGHCEMLLEVAGLDRSRVAERTARLASGDWSAFPPEEQRAYALARKLTAAPWFLERADIAGLERDYAPARARSLIWWLCRGLYMTRISDGFQLTLEPENVFRTMFPTAPAN
jgi:alkylhydroperoxidase family enzyme